MKKGYVILKKNFRSYYGEIDIVAFDPQAEMLVFVEVKLRDKNAVVKAEESITYEKINRIKKAALNFINVYKGRFYGMRFDVIGIEKDGEKVEISHIENAF